MMKHFYYIHLFFFGLLAVVSATNHPNIILIYADDLGYGDVSSYNPDSKVTTPHMDRLAAEGLKFTDAHSAATVCTPSRYAVMTGRMPFRLNFRGVFTGVEGPCLIKNERLTLPEMLQQVGYRTALMGKWHIGMTFLDHDGRPVYETCDERGIPLIEHTDLSRPIADGPLDHGFDHFLGLFPAPRRIGSTHTLMETAFKHSLRVSECVRTGLSIHGLGISEQASPLPILTSKKSTWSF